MINFSPCLGLKKTIGIGLAAGSLLIAPLSGKAQSSLNTEYVGDTFETSVVEVPPAGTVDKSVLLGAPNPKIFINGQRKTAAFVVDLSKNVLYHYDENGEALSAYLVASGKKSTPTHTGVRYVSHVETYPYKGAPPGSKRRRNPRDYGPKCIILDKLDPQTGERSSNGEFIHGNRNPESIGSYVSHGCIRMDNEVIKYLSTQVKCGDIVIVKR